MYLLQIISYFCPSFMLLLHSKFLPNVWACCKSISKNGAEFPLYFRGEEKWCFVRDWLFYVDFYLPHRYLASPHSKEMLKHSKVFKYKRSEYKDNFLCRLFAWKMIEAAWILLKWTFGLPGVDPGISTESINNWKCSRMRCISSELANRTNSNR